MKAFLKDAEKNQEQDNLVQQWVFEITSVANDAVYILEAYSLDAAKDGDHAAAFVDHLKAYACICQKEAKLHNIGKDIQSLKERVMDISRKRYTYGIAHINNNAGEGPSNRPNYPSSMLTLRRAVSNADEDQLFVGFQEVYQRLLDELLKEESHRKVLSIYGMGGLGKTTLARNLYNSPSLITTFHTRAWICVSQQYSTPDLLRSIIKSIEGCSEELLKLLKEMSERELETYLCDLLKERKYLVVVDDVWHREAWESLKRALPDKNNGSRVILTTRTEEVAERVDDKGFSHKLRFLNNEESWDLLCKKLRPENKMVGADLFSPSMERLAKEMVEKCRGLPLAIVVLGGILSYRKGVDEWQKVKTHLWQHMKNDSVEITYILSLSYNDLSFELKQCFLYIGIFQEDHVIDAEKLMHLWLAEGFIPRIREEHMEDIAENFLHELISRSLIQVAETFFDKIFACKIHDLLRDLAVQKSMEVRSILFFDKEFENLDHSEKFMTFCTTFPHLYVLDLENIYFSDGKLPDAIGNLVHLKFLGLCNTNLFKLPPSIGKLKCLQTLEALKSDHCSCKLPPQVAQLTNLRHLVARYEVPLEVNRLTNLRTLKYIRCDQWKDTDASGLVNLQELGMEQIVKSYSLKSIGSLKSLTTLFLICSPGGPFPPLEPLSSCENLHRLWLSGGIEEVANLNNLPKTITVLVLQSTFYTGLEEDPMPILGKFPNLKYLELSCTYKGKKITCKGNGFGQLETLRLENLDNLESWHLHTTAMSVLKSLSIRGCPKLKKIPKRMEHIAVLDGNQSKLVDNAGLWAMTRGGGRRVVQISAAFMFFFSILGKFKAIFASIPASIMAAIYCIFFRTNFILELFNDTMSVIFTSHAMVAAAVAVFLDKTLPFSNDEARKDHGSHWWDKMVDAVVSYAVKKLGDFLVEEVSLRQSLKENVLWLRNELSFMQAFLKDAEKQQAENHLVQQWVFEITSVANEAVAILEAYSLDAAKDGDHASTFVHRLKACACICKKEAKFHNIGKNIQSLKERVMDISRKRDTYDITQINNNAAEGSSNRPNDSSFTLVRTLRRAVSYADEDQLFVGFQEVFQRLLDELLIKESHRKVLSIYGMGGLGKTTLARNLYNSPSLITTFRTRAWICISQQYSTQDLLRSIIKSIEGCSQEMLKMLKEMSERDLETHLRNLLKDCKYLVVVDDVWHREAWESLKRALPDNSYGSRVILTTRKEDVAKRVDDKGFSHKLHFLNKEESWDLLCKKLCPENKMVGADLFSPSMESLAKEMVEKCRGLPLAIVVLGGILSYRKGVDEWQKVKTHLWQHMKNDSVEITHILSLSYNDLSFELKQCFLYIGIFQEDHVIDTEKLMYLWLAEGFIPRIREEHMEDIAENFLHELISRSLFQVVETFFNKILTCRIHDLLRDLAVQKAMEVNLFDIYDPRVNSVTPFRHRHAIYAETQRYLSIDFSELKVRSMLFFDKEFMNLGYIKKFMTFCTTFPHLYVLDLENIRFYGGELPDAIGNLVHLKFLGFSNTSISKLPPSIGKLKGLQTLDALTVDHCSCELPPQVTQLTNLRHLITRYEVPLQVDKLTNLRTLKYIRCDQWKDTDAAGLINLQELGMERIRKSYSLKSIGSLKSLSTLFLVCQYGETFPPLEPLSSCENLYRLLLSGGIEELADLNKLPKSITVLVLQSAGLEEDPMPIMGKFPNLKHLELSRAYKGKKITCKCNSFGQLETLRLGNLENLDSWHLDTTAMSLIKSLSIFECPKLKNIPERMEHVVVHENNQRRRDYYYRFPIN
ncbi:hypothetical protein KY289_021650 [Solanum tuberosum]|nr:hypothetical protein KY289_021650 [Solanum tuberosum]